MKGRVEANVLLKSRWLVEKFRLCPSCLGRQFPYSMPKLTNYEKGRVIYQALSVKQAREADCYLCSGMLASTEEKARKIADTLSGFEFQTFSIGCSLSPDFLEKEDSIRSEFKLRGGETIKGALTHEVRRAVSSLTGARVKLRKPDVVVLLNPVADLVRVIPRSIFVFGRYVKKVRGLPQKDRIGEGDSVESILRQKLRDYFQARGIKFAWMGGEDEDSLVLGSGRPFYAEVLEPKKRILTSLNEFARSNDEGVTLTDLKVLEQRPPNKAKFTVKIAADVELESPLQAEVIKKLENNFRDLPVKALSTKKAKTMEKKIYSLEVKEVMEKKLNMIITCDGGLNIKKFVSGGASEVSPSIAEFLGQRAECKYFDVLDVEVLEPLY